MQSATYFPLITVLLGAEQISFNYHASTQLPDGKLSMIVDPGAWTNFMGVNLARKLAERAVKHGHKPTIDGDVSHGQDPDDDKVENDDFSDVGVVD